MVAGDIPGVVEIEAGLPSAPHWSATAYESAIAPDGGVLRFALVAEAEGELVGFLVASLVGAEAELEAIAVAQIAQRQGVAKMLLAAVLDNLRANGAGEVVLEVRASNHPALSLYKWAGFSEFGRRRNYYRDPVEDALILRMAI
jgi:ribosomal-protein-alanine N-acetyltransferase